MEMFLAAWFVAWVVTHVPAALGDAYEQRKAAKAGEWDHLTKLREARKQPPEPPRAGLKAWATDVWHGAWEDTLDRREKRRKARKPFDPATPTLADRAYQWGRSRAEKRRGRHRRGNTKPATPPAGKAPDLPEADKLDWSWAKEPKPDQPDTQPAPRPVADPETPGGDVTTPTIADVQTNEAARQAFEEMKQGAAQLAEAARLAEEARKRIAANAQAASDGMGGVKFDRGATAAVGDIADTVHDGTLARWSEVADQIGGAADAGIASLEKYRDAEDVVASNDVDAKTLEPTAS